MGGSIKCAIKSLPSLRTLHGYGFAPYRRYTIVLLRESGCPSHTLKHIDTGLRLFLTGSQNSLSSQAVVCLETRKRAHKHTLYVVVLEKKVIEVSR